MSYNHRYRAKADLCIDMALQADLSKHLPKIQSIFHPEEQKLFFAGNSLAKVILADFMSFPVSKSRC